MDNLIKKIVMIYAIIVTLSVTLLLISIGILYGLNIFPNKRLITASKVYKNGPEAINVPKQKKDVSINDLFKNSLNKQANLISKQSDIHNEELELDTFKIKMDMKMREFMAYENKLKNETLKLEKEKKDFEEKMKQLLSPIIDQKFEENINIFQKLPPLETVNIMSEWDVNEITRYIRNFSERYAAKVITGFNQTNPQLAKEIELALKKEASMGK